MRPGLIKGCLVKITTLALGLAYLTQPTAHAETINTKKPSEDLYKKLEMLDKADVTHIVPKSQAELAKDKGLELLPPPTPSQCMSAAGMRFLNDKVVFEPKSGDSSIVLRNVYNDLGLSLNNMDKFYEFIDRRKMEYAETRASEEEVFQFYYPSDGECQCIKVREEKGTRKKMQAKHKGKSDPILISGRRTAISEVKSIPPKICENIWQKKVPVKDFSR